MNISRINPFNELYVTETVRPEHFVTLFSPVLLDDALPLFQPGNVVVKGTQGSGKSMLLNLLKTDIRIAYKKADKALPLPRDLQRFVGVGINFTRSGAVDFGQRAVEPEPIKDIARIPFYFADFFNYWIVYDILRSIQTLATECDGAIGREMEINWSPEARDRFAVSISKDPCWNGYLEGRTDIESLSAAIQERISTYRRFLNFSMEALPRSFQDTITPIGEPISRTAEELWHAKVLPREVPIFVRVDQYEELCRLEDWSQSAGISFRRIVNKALGLRDPRISYRIGARRYGWSEDIQVFGTNSVLELERDYKVVDIDDILRRKENRSTWIFPRFAEDVFSRRLSFAGYHNATQKFKSVMKGGMTPSELATRYARNAGVRTVQLDPEWDGQFAEKLLELARTDPFQAKLAEAWKRQDKPIPPGEAPWQSKDAAYWRKERSQQALMHIAASCGQRMIWGGSNDILALSGGNILVFVSLCQHIWAAWTRSIRGVEVEEEQVCLPEICFDVQAVGIQSASIYWHGKVAEQIGTSRDRQKFISFLGRFFREKLLADKEMSYPGHNGFSIREEELAGNSDIAQFLNDAVDYGDLFDAPHTTKNKDRKPRRKWYLNPIFSPFFQIPENHVKEPMYVTISDIKVWLQKSGVRRTEESTEGPVIATDKDQLSLFDSTSGE